MQVNQFSDEQLVYFDNVTPKYHNIMIHVLSKAERRIVVALARIGHRARVKDITDTLYGNNQENLISAQLHRLCVIKEILNRNENGYDFNDPDFKTWICLRNGCIYDSIV